VKKISTASNGVRGITSVDDELFVLLHQDSDQVAVYNIRNYKLLRHINLLGLKENRYNDITSCVRHRCLYVSNNERRCIHKFQLTSGAVTKWSVPGSPCSLSVTPDCNVLVVCGYPCSKLVELSADDGQCVREITLQSVLDPYRAVLLATGQFVVCCGDWERSYYQVCLVDAEGKLSASQHKPLVVGCPTHMAVDEDSQVIYVSDSERVVLLSPTLEIVGELREGLSGSRPLRLYLHHATRRLFVSLDQRKDDIIVIRL